MKSWILWCSLFFGFVPVGFSLQLLVTGDMAGEIRPCGCSVEGQRGGIERLSAFLKTQKATSLWVDLGNYSVEPSAQGQLKNQLYQKLFHDRQLFALLPGPKEFSTGKRGLAKNPLPYLLTNHQSELPHVASVKQQGGWQFFGFLSPSFFSQGTHQGGVLEGVSAFLNRAKKLSSKPGKALLLFRGSPQELAQVEASGLFDQILLANQSKIEKSQQLQIKTPMGLHFSPPMQGQGVLRLHLATKQSQIHWLNPDSPRDPDWAEPFANYDKKVANLFFKLVALKGKQKEKRVYKGSASCVRCHLKQGEVWSKTQHAQAYHTLEKAGRQFDPDCLVCHTQGLNKGGFISHESTPGLENVGCENCHGLMSARHSTDPGYKARRPEVTATTCVTCHRGNHSPKFNFDTYFPKIKH